MVLNSDTIDAFLKVLQRLRNDSTQRLNAVDEHSVDTVANYLAGLSAVRCACALRLCLRWHRGAAQLWHGLRAAGMILYRQYQPPQ